MTRNLSFVSTKKSQTVGSTVHEQLSVGSLFMMHCIELSNNCQTLRQMVPIIIKGPRRYLSQRKANLCTGGGHVGSCRKDQMLCGFG